MLGDPSGIVAGVRAVRWWLSGLDRGRRRSRVALTATSARFTRIAAREGERPLVDSVVVDCVDIQRQLIDQENGSSAATIDQRVTARIVATNDRGPGVLLDRV